MDSRRRRNTMMFRWSLTTTILTALFWTSWYLIFGEVPSLSSIQVDVDREVSLNLPFTISRWWDILFTPVWTVLLVFVFSKTEENDDDNFVIALVASGLVTALVAGLGIALGAGPVIGLVIGLVTGLVAGLGTALSTGLDTGLSTGLGTGLGTGLVIGLGTGLVIGLGIGLVTGLVIGLVLGLGTIIKGVMWLLSKNTLQKCYNWLMVS